MIAVSAANPAATQQQIAEIVGVSQQRVSRVTSEIQAKSEPKLLKHGGNMAEQDSYNNLGRGKPYILARLKRDGHQELAEQVKAGMLSARKAGIEIKLQRPTGVKAMTTEPDDSLTATDTPPVARSFLGWQSPRVREQRMRAALRLREQLISIPFHQEQEKLHPHMEYWLMLQMSCVNI